MNEETTPEITGEEQLSEEQKQQLMLRRIKARDVKLSRMEEQKSALKEQREHLEFRRRNYNLLLNGAYPDCERNIHEESEIRPYQKNKSEYWNTGNKAFENAVLFESWRREIMFLAVLQCFGGIIPWAWTEGRFIFSKFPMNFITLLYALFESVTTANMSAIGTGSLILLIFMGMVLILNGMVIREYRRNASEQDYSSCVRIAGVTSLATSIVFLVASSAIQTITKETEPTTLTNGSGVWFTFFCSVIMLYILHKLEKLPVPEPYRSAEYRSLNLADIDEDEELSEKGLILEVTNYDPVFRFRIVRLMVTKLSDREIEIQAVVRNYNRQGIESLKCEIHFLHPDGSHLTLPIMELKKSEDSDDTDEIMTCLVNAIGFNFRAYDQARIYPEECTFKDGTAEPASGITVKSDLTLEEIKSTREELGSQAIRAPKMIGRYRMCCCGQLLNEDDRECPMCHGITQEVMKDE